MANLAKNRVSNEAVAGMQQDLANKQLGSLLPIFAELVQSGQGMFGSNPMMSLMGGMFGQPMQVQTPDFLQEFIAKYNLRSLSRSLPRCLTTWAAWGQTGIGAMPST